MQDIQGSIAIVARRSKDVAVHELLGSRAGVPLGGPYYGTLARIGRANECTLSELADFLGLELSTISRRVKFLEDHGLVQRRTDENDRRSSLVQLTARGHELHGMFDEGWLEILGELTDGWNAEEVDHFAAQLARFSSALERLATERGGSPLASWVSAASPKAGDR